MGIWDDYQNWEAAVQNGIALVLREDTIGKVSCKHFARYVQETDQLIIMFWTNPAGVWQGKSMSWLALSVNDLQRLNDLIKHIN